MTNDPWGWYAYQHVGRERLTNYLRDDPQPGNLVQALLTPFRDLEYLHHQLFDMLSIHKATGKGLDSFGEMVKIARLGRDDNTYRLAILAKRFSSGGSGTPEEIKRALRNIVVGSDVKLVNHYPAAFIAQIRTSASGIDATLTQLISNMAIAGVHGYATFDYGQGGFVLSGVAGQLYNALGVGPTASGNNDTVMGVNVTARAAAPAGEPQLPATGDPITLNGSDGLMYKTAPGLAAVTLYTGQVWTGQVIREGSNVPSSPSSVLTAPDAAVANVAISGAGVTITATAPGATVAVIKSGATSQTDTMVVFINVAGTDVLGVNAATATVGGTPLAGQPPATVDPDAYYFGTYQE